MIQWKPITGFEEIYKISNFGEVRRTAFGYGTRKNKILKPIITQDGYQSVYLYKGDGTRKKKFIHGLVAEAFVGKRPKRFEVNHKNGNKSDNNFRNLEYLSKRENILQSIKDNRHFIPRGSQHGLAKLKEYQIKMIKHEYKRGDVTLKSIAKKYGIKSITTISRIIHGDGWTHV